MKPLIVMLALAMLVAGWSFAVSAGSFAAHMTAHVAAVAVVAPLLVLSVPWRPGWLRAPGSALFACGVEFAVVWGWHLPWLHGAARDQVAVFALEQISFLLAGWAVWASALPASGRNGRGNALAGVGALLMTSMHMTLLGGLLTVVPRPLFEHAHLTDALWDQQLGGAIMLSVGGLAYLIGALGVLGQLLRDEPGWRESS